MNEADAWIELRAAGEVLLAPRHNRQNQVEAIVVAQMLNRGVSPSISSTITSGQGTSMRP
ncbi:hypothetical protein [uncultured Jannaschia sp.]|uniref:hypothetical protein n=1 Tax=uncultured Jannaschia sp. TaxID=293347 RepID=UPI0026067258|nr:hypothetical protein [uncultured Jannaschia sp.]